MQLAFQLHCYSNVIDNFNKIKANSQRQVAGQTLRGLGERGVVAATAAGPTGGRFVPVHPVCARLIAFQYGLWKTENQNVGPAGWCRDCAGCACGEGADCGIAPRGSQAVWYIWLWLEGVYAEHAQKVKEAATEINVRKFRTGVLSSHCCCCWPASCSEREAGVAKPSSCTVCAGSGAALFKLIGCKAAPSQP